MSKFFRRGKTRFFFVPTIAAGTKIPTTAEITAGTELTPNVNDVGGFTFANERINTPTLDTTFTAGIGGEDTAEDSSLTFYLDSATNTLRTTLAKGVQGFIVIFDYKIGAPAVADKVDTWPIEVASAPKQYSMGNDPALWVANFGITGTPQFDGALVT